MNRIFRTWFLVGLAGLMVVGQSAVRAANDSAPTPKRTHKKVISENPYLGAIVVDNATGKVLFEDKADAEGYPASVLKLMDLLIVLEKIEQKQLTLQDPVVVSAKASHIGGSRVWLAEKESFTVDEMLYALMVQSANDAAVALAEKVAGTTDGRIEAARQCQEAGLTVRFAHWVGGRRRRLSPHLAIQLTVRPADAVTPPSPRRTLGRCPSRVSLAHSLGRSEPRSCWPSAASSRRARPGIRTAGSWPGHCRSRA